MQEKSRRTEILDFCCKYADFQTIVCGFCAVVRFSPAGDFLGSTIKISVQIEL